jgi:two-component system, NtrC family, sensor kinase
VTTPDKPVTPPEVADRDDNAPLGDLPFDAQTQADVFRTLIDIVPDRIYAKDRQNRFILANCAQARFMGVATPQDLIGKSDVDFYAPDKAAEFVEVERQVLEAGESLIAIEQFSPNPHTGALEWTQATKVPLHDKQGQVIGLVGLAHDITERKRYEAEIQQRNAELAALNQQLSQAQQQLMQSEKLAAIGQLAAGVAHEINNPIVFIYSNFNTLDGYMKQFHRLLAAFTEAQRGITDPQVLAQLNSLRKDADLDFLLEDSQNLMTETRDGLTRVKKIVLDLKNFSRVDDVAEWGEADLHQCFDTTLNILASEIRHKADVVKLYAEIPPVACIVSQINQVILNLLLNATDAIGPQRGTITVRTGVDDDPGKEAQHVWFEVSDTGCGMTKEALQRIFEPFYTTKPIGKGTGLGLSLSYGIVQGHHGRIDVSSELGAGTCFRVTLPVKHANT